MLDLHWHVVCERHARRRVLVPTGGLLARAHRQRVGNRMVPVLDPVDTLVHLAVHASMSGADRLGWLKDIEQCLLRWPPDWPEVVDRARTGGAAVPTAVVLARSRSVLGVPVPDDALAALVPSGGWRRLLATTDAVFPVSRLAPGGSPARLIARAARDDVPGTLWETAGRAWDWVRGGAQVKPLNRSRDLDPAFAGSLLHPAGTANDRRAYFAAVREET